MRISAKALAILGCLASFPLFAQGDAPAEKGGGGMAQTLIMILVALAFFYFILWRPEQKRRKQMASLRSSLKKGDRITAMGILGTVIKVQENTVIVSLCEGAKMELMKAAITDVQSAPSSSEEEKPTEEKQ